MIAVDHPDLVRRVVIAAAASKDYPKDLLVSLRDAAVVALPDQQRLAALASHSSRLCRGSADDDLDLSAGGDLLVDQAWDLDDRGTIRAALEQAVAFWSAAPTLEALQK
jgi:hypothetical protein